jgi:AcrR family transcriptional regulator
LSRTKPAHDSALGRADWIRAACETLAEKGVDSVRVESLARRLRISKGSFYWHFKDRDDLLDAVLSSWVMDHGDWELRENGRALTAAESWARLLELLSRPSYGRLDLAISQWARQEEKVQHRVSEVERKRLAFLAQVFREVGFSARQAEEWAQSAMLLYLGWVNRASRDSAFRDSGPELAELLSRLILAASALASQETA